MLFYLQHPRHHIPTCASRVFQHTCGEIDQLSNIQTFMIMMVCASWSITHMQSAAGVNLVSQDASENALTQIFALILFGSANKT